MLTTATTATAVAVRRPLPHRARLRACYAEVLCPFCQGSGQRTYCWRALPTHRLLSRARRCCARCSDTGTLTLHYDPHTQVLSVGQTASALVPLLGPTGPVSSAKGGQDATHFLLLRSGWAASQRQRLSRLCAQPHAAH